MTNGTTESPEERLLKVIQKGGQDSAGGGETESPSAPRPAEEARARAGEPQPALTRKLTTVAARFSLRERELSGLNGVLFIIFAVFVALIVHKVVAGRPGIEHIEEEVRKIQQGETGRTDVALFKPLDEYRSAVSRRNIFMREVTPGAADARVLPAELEAYREKLSLVGIFRESGRKEVMIEDREAKKTYFIEEGGEFKGIRVKKIEKDKAVLEYGGKEFDLI